MNIVCPNCRNPTAIDATKCVYCGALFSDSAGWKPAPLDMLPRSDTSGSTRDAILRNSIVASVVSLLCISAFPIYLLVLEKSGFNEISSLLFMFILPFIVHAIAFFMLLLRPGLASITTSSVIGAIGAIVTLFLILMSIIINLYVDTRSVAIFLGAQLLYVLSGIYFVCQVVSVVQASRWKNIV